MKHHTPFANWLMQLATRDPIAGRHEWAKAMQGEYGALEKGHLSWAIGCAITSVGWALKADKLFFIAIPLGALFIKLLMGSFIYHLITIGVEKSIFGREISFYFRGILPYAILSMLFGILRPNRTALVSILFYVSTFIISYVYFGLYFHQEIGTFYLNVYDMPPIIGEFVVFIVVLAFVTMGSWMRRSFSKGVEA